MKLRLELIDDHEGSVSYRTVSLEDYDNDHVGSLDDMVGDMLDSYQKSKQPL